MRLLLGGDDPSNDGLLDGDAEGYTLSLGCSDDPADGAALGPLLGVRLLLGGDEPSNDGLLDGDAEGCTLSLGCSDDPADGAALGPLLGVRLCAWRRRALK